jgi:hypothetical protein
MLNVSIIGLDKAKVLAALYNGARAQGAGFIHYDPTPMSEDEASKILQHQIDFDYLKGRVMKVDLSGDEIDPWGYDRDNGQGAVEEIVSALRQTDDVNPEEAEIQHKEGTRDAAIYMEEHVDDPNYTKVRGDTLIYGLGTGDLAPLIKPKIKQVLDDNS